MDTGEVVAVTFQPLVSETALHITEKRDGEVAYVGPVRLTSMARRCCAAS